MRVSQVIITVVFSFSFCTVFSQVQTHIVKGRKLLDTNEVVYNEAGKPLRYYQYTKLVNSGDYGIRLSGHPDDPQKKRFLKKLTVAEQMRMAEWVKTNMPIKSPVLKEGMKLNVLPFLEVFSKENWNKKSKF